MKYAIQYVLGGEVNTHYSYASNWFKKSVSEDNTWTTDINEAHRGLARAQKDCGAGYIMWLDEQQ